MTTLELIQAILKVSYEWEVGSKDVDWGAVMANVYKNLPDDSSSYEEEDRIFFFRIALLAAFSCACWDLQLCFL